MTKYVVISMEEEVFKSFILEHEEGELSIVGEDGQKFDFELENVDDKNPCD